MKCPNCSAPLNPGDLYCGECGQAVSGTTPPPLPSEPPPHQSPQPLQPPVQRGSYGAEISRQNPGCIVFLVDQSGSMDEAMAGATGQRKKEAVADAINRLLYNLVLRCSREDGVRPYFDLGVWTYRGSATVERAFSADLVSVADIAEHPKRMEKRRRRAPDGAGGVYEQEFELPIWFEPLAEGRTPMHAAFSAAVGPLRQWLSQHSASFPPVIINLTDGVYTDQNPAPVARELTQMGTADGNVLLFNCHVSEKPDVTVTFPDAAQGAGLSGLKRELFDISSPLPEPMARHARAKGYQIGAGARGYAYNADFVTLIDFLDVGTRAVQDRMETS
jgi:hypothetical protein